MEKIKNYKNLFFIIAALAMLRLFLGPIIVFGLSYKKFSILFVVFIYLASLILELKILLPSALLFSLSLSDFFSRRFTFFTDLQLVPEIFWLGLLCAVISIKKINLSKQYFVFLLLLQFIIAGVFIKQADGNLLFSDDHPSFLYRLILLKEHFPFIPFYDVNWNTGYSAREFFASGILNIFFASAPLVYLFDLSNYNNAYLYNYIIVWGYVFLIPWAVFTASRIMGFSMLAAFCSAVLALGPSTGQFEWLLKYGTLGFCFASGMLPLAFAMSMRVAFEKISWLDILFLLVTSFLVLSWSLSFLAFLPLVVIALANYKTVFSVDKRFKIFIFVMLFLCLNLPWVLVFIKESKVTSFVSTAALPGAKHLGFDLTLALKNFRSLVQKVNPLILCLWLFGLAQLRDIKKQSAYFASILLLLLVAFIGEQYKPQLELKRMIIPASYLMCLLAGALIASSFSTLREMFFEKKYINKILGYSCFVLFSGFLFLSPLNVAAVYANRSDEKFKFSDSSVLQLIEGIRKYADDNRVFFSGFVLQELGATNYSSQDGGHIAPLTAFTQKAMFASHYYHKYWTIVDPIPTSYRSRGEQGIEEFLDLINASSVVTHSAEWANYCSTKSRYQQMFQAGRFRFFKRESDNLGYFYKGSGEVKKAKEGILIKPKTEEVVVKFRYLPKLKVYNSLAQIFPEPVYIEELGGEKKEQVNYIRLKIPQAELMNDNWIKVGYYP